MRDGFVGDSNYHWLERGCEDHGGKNYKQKIFVWSFLILYLHKPNCRQALIGGKLDPSCDTCARKVIYSLVAKNCSFLVRPAMPKASP